ncbi:AmmeMemoRadiSam system radical SAM enzyme, partial [Bacteroidota bacterium]
VLSVGSIGCNLRCEFCQNCKISQATLEEFPWATQYSPEQLVEMASNESNNIGLAFTYNEPTIFYEFLKETACLAKVHNLQNVAVSNGYINREPLNELFPFLDAFNIDLKAFTDEFYTEITGGSIEPVKRTLKSIKNEGKHLEITHLVIPQLNDKENDFKNMVHWIANELGNDTVLHISRYFPAHLSRLPATSVSTLDVFFNIACEVLDYVYLGNVRGNTETYCRKCGNTVIRRNGYYTEVNGITESGQCIECGEKIVIN